MHPLYQRASLSRPRETIPRSTPSHKRPLRQHRPLPLQHPLCPPLLHQWPFHSERRHLIPLLFRSAKRPRRRPRRSPWRVVGLGCRRSETCREAGGQGRADKRPSLRGGKQRGQRGPAPWGRPSREGVRARGDVREERDADTWGSSSDTGTRASALSAERRILIRRQVYTSLLGRQSTQDIHRSQASYLPGAHRRLFVRIESVQEDQQRHQGPAQDAVCPICDDQQAHCLRLSEPCAIARLALCASPLLLRHESSERRHVVSFY